MLVRFLQSLVVFPQIVCTPAHINLLAHSPFLQRLGPDPGPLLHPNLPRQEHLQRESPPGASFASSTSGALCLRRKTSALLPLLFLSTASSVSLLLRIVDMVGVGSDLGRHNHSRNRGHQPDRRGKFPFLPYPRARRLIP